MNEGSHAAVEKKISPALPVLCIDLGGTKSAASLMTPGGDLLRRVSGPTPATEGAESITRFLIGMAKRAAEEAGTSAVRGIGISAGAPADSRSGRIFDAPNLPGWGATDGFPLAERLSEAFGGVPAFVENDADATALAEYRFGAGKGSHTMAFLTVGTGIGSGLILDGRLHRGMRGAGGEVGHIAVEAGGRPCACGLRGCLEAYASGPSVVRVAVENGFAGEATGPAVIAAARAGDRAAKFAVDQAARMLGRGIASLAMLLNPERVVLGTLAVHAGDLLLPLIRETVVECTWPRISDGLEIVPAALGDRAQDLAALCVYLNHTQ